MEIFIFEEIDFLIFENFFPIKSKSVLLILNGFTLHFNESFRLKRKKKRDIKEKSVRRRKFEVTLHFNGLIVIPICKNAIIKKNNVKKKKVGNFSKI